MGDPMSDDRDGCGGGKRDSRISGFNPEKHVNEFEEEVVRLSQELYKAKEVINNRNEIIRKLVRMFASHGIEVSGIGDLDHDRIIEVD